MKTCFVHSFWTNLLTDSGIKYIQQSLFATHWHNVTIVFLSVSFSSKDELGYSFWVYIRVKNFHPNTFVII